MGFAVPAKAVADARDGWRGILTRGQIGRGAQESGFNGGTQAVR